MRTVEWANGMVRMIDQKVIPWELVQVDLPDYQAVAAAITDMTVRGAPAIGAAAGFGLALAAKQSAANTVNALWADLDVAASYLKAARPTAVNLAWAVDRLMGLARGQQVTTPDELRVYLLTEAQRIADEDVAINQRMGANGAALIKDGDTILHHCNTGALATVDYGTALGVVRAAFEQGKKIHV
ncbi:MAG: S-methyl-5-thioribose-1-phosphate isomerase, partial [Anaerolineae bacterium]|nr:S-methyl-5-thioribose-1-phosphate isomerase [Anaerolineae bacterium]